MNILIISDFRDSGENSGHFEICHASIDIITSGANVRYTRGGNVGSISITSRELAG